MRYIPRPEIVSYKGKTYTIIRDRCNGMIDIAEVIKDGNPQTIRDYHKCIYRSELDNAKPYAKVAI